MRKFNLNKIYFGQCCTIKNSKLYKAIERKLMWDSPVNIRNDIGVIKELLSWKNILES